MVEVIIIELCVRVSSMSPLESLANEVRNCFAPWSVSDDLGSVFSISDGLVDNIPGEDSIFILGHSLGNITLKEGL